MFIGCICFLSREKKNHRKIILYAEHEDIFTIWLWIFHWSHFLFFLNVLIEKRDATEEGGGDERLSRGAVKAIIFSITIVLVAWLSAQHATVGSLLFWKDDLFPQPLPWTFFLDKSLIWPFCPSLLPSESCFGLFFLFLEKYVVKAQCVVKKHEHEISRTRIPHWLLIFDLVGEKVA